MKTIFRILGVCCAMLAGWGYAQPLPPATTAYTRDVLRASNQSNFWYKIGIVQSNQTQVTNWITTIPAGTVTPAMLATTVSNAYMWAGTNAARAVIVQSNLVTAAQVGVQIGSSNLVTAAQVASQVTGSNYLTAESTLDGTKLGAGTVNSNALDTLTKAQLALAGTGGGTTTPASLTATGLMTSNQVALITGTPRTAYCFTPPDGWNTYPSVTYDETQILTFCSNMWYWGFVKAGMDTFELSDGWGNTNRDVSGNLVENPTQFPHGMKYLVDVCYTNYGMKLGGFMEACAGSDVGKVSIWGSIPATGLAHLEQDAGTMAGTWGMWHIRVDYLDALDWDDQRVFLNRLAYAVDYASKTNSWFAHPVTIQWFCTIGDYWNANLPSPVPLQIPNWVNMMRFGSDQDTLEHIRKNWDWAKSQFYLVGRGHYIHGETVPDFGTVDGFTENLMRTEVALGAAAHRPLQFTWNGFATDPMTYLTKAAYATNSYLASIRRDSLCLAPTIAYTNVISGTNAGECWITALENGDYSVVLWCRDQVGTSLTNVIYATPGLTTYEALHGKYNWQQNITSGVIWTNQAATYTVLYDDTGNTHLSQNAYWYVTNNAGAVVYYWPYQTLTNGVQWIGTNAGAGSVFGGFYLQGRNMAFGSTNIPALGSSTFQYVDVWTGAKASAATGLTWPVPADDAAMFRVQPAAMFPASAIASGDIDAAQITSGTLPLARLSNITSNQFDAGTKAQLALAGTGSGSGDMLAANNLSDVASQGQSRTNLAAHNASNLTTGTLDTARLPDLSGTYLPLHAQADSAATANAVAAGVSNAFDVAGAALAATNTTRLQTQLTTGTATGSKFLRDDWSWQTPAGSGDVVAAGNNNLSGSNNFAGVTVFSNNITVYGSLTVNSTNATTTVSNLLATGTISGNGSGLTNLSAANIASGTLNPARLAAGPAQSKVPSVASGATTWEWVDMTPAFSLSAAHTFTGTNTFTVGTRTFAHDSSHTVITNTATLVSTEWTAGSQKEWYNGATTLTTDKTNGMITANSFVCPVASDNGVVLDARKQYQLFVTNASYSMTGFGNLISGTRHVFSVCVSNSAATAITITGVPGCRYFGSASTNSLVLASGKQAYWDFDVRSTVVSNCVNIAEQ